MRRKKAKKSRKAQNYISSERLARFAFREKLDRWEVIGCARFSASRVTGLDPCAL